VEHSAQVDDVLSAIAHADCDEEDTLDLEQFGRRLRELRGAIALLPVSLIEAEGDRTSRAAE
jgi:hypothetical protein